MPADLPGYHIEQLGPKEIDKLEAINYTLFREKWVINKTNHEFLIILRACIHDIPIGFKIGYGRDPGEFYSAKGGVLPQYRRHGIALDLLNEMMRLAREGGYQTFVYDTFPNLHSGMLILGLNHNFKVIEARWNAQYKDFQITLSKGL